MKSNQIICTEFPLNWNYTTKTRFMWKVTICMHTKFIEIAHIPRFELNIRSSNTIIHYVKLEFIFTATYPSSLSFLFVLLSPTLSLLVFISVSVPYTSLPWSPFLVTEIIYRPFCGLHFLYPTINLHNATHTEQNTCTHFHGNAHHYLVL